MFAHNKTLTTFDHTEAAADGFRKHCDEKKRLFNFTPFTNGYQDVFMDLDQTLQSHLNFRLSQSSKNIFVCDFNQLYLIVLLSCQKRNCLRVHNL